MENTRWGKKFFMITVFIVVLCVLPVFGNQILNLTEEEKEYIQEGQVITVGQIRNRHPFSCIDEDTGELSGINEDILEEISDMTGLKFRSEPLKLNEKTAEALESGRVDLVMGVLKGSQSNLIYTDPFIKSRLSMVVREKRNFDPNKNNTVALKKSFQGMQDYISQHYPNYDTVYCSTDEECLKTVLSGKADVMMQNVYVVNYLLQKPQYEQMEILPATFVMEENVFAARNDIDPQIISILNKAVHALTEEKMNTIILANTAAKPYRLTMSDIFFKYRYQLITIGVLCGIFLLLICQNLSIRKKSAEILRQKNQELEKAVREAKAANAAKSQFLSRMSHEIRTPMNAIVGLTEIAKQHGNEPQKMELYLEKIEDSSKVLLGILNDILDMSAIESNKLKIAESVFNLREIADRISSIYHMQCSNKGITFEMKTEIRDEVLLGDGLRLNQILMNLASNAFKFTEPGGSIKIQILQIEKKENTAGYRISVTDTGCGMDTEMMERLFCPFEQESSETAQKYGGSGLGLSIVKNIVEMMHGNIQVTSKKNEGSCFKVELSFKLADESEKKENLEKQSQKHSSDVRKKAYDFSGYRVLLAEDNALNAEIAIELLSMVHMDCIHVQNGKEAVEALKNSTPGTFDAILMDIQMPVLDGYEAARKIRALPHPQADQIPIIAMTANAFTEDIAKAHECGMNEHIAKPIDTQLFYSVLEKMIK